MRKLLLLCVFALLCGCTPKESVQSLPPVEVQPPQVVEETPVEVQPPQVIEETPVEVQPPQVAEETPVEMQPPQVSEVVTQKPEEETAVGAEPPAAETCTFSISCKALCENRTALDADKHELVPEDGWILPPTSVELEEGESVFDLLQRLCRTSGILMEFTTSPVYQTAYIEGISNLYEFDAGPLSGWVYSVNGVTPNYGCSAYYPKADDTICWEYKVE